MKIYQTPQPPVCFFGGCSWPLTFLTGGLSQPLGFADDRKLFSQWEIHQPGIHLGNQQIFLFYYNCLQLLYIYIIAIINITIIIATTTATATATTIITACLPPCLPTYPPTYLPTHLPIYPPTHLPTYLLLAFKPLIKNSKNGVPRAANPGIVHTTGRGSAAGCAGAAGNLSLMWDAINNYHGLGDGFIKDVHTTHKNYDFGVFIMFYDVLLLVSNGGDLGMVYHCFAMCSFSINDMRVQGYWRFHQGPQSLIFQY